MDFHPIPELFPDNSSKYKEKYLKKKATYEQLDIKVLWLDIQEIENLFSEYNLTLQVRDNKGCKLCGNKSLNLIKELCHKCYCKTWRQGSDRQTGWCAFCQKQFPQYSQDCKFCSKECYWNSLKLDLPSVDWLEDQLASRSLSEIANELGVKYYTLHKRLYRSRRRKSQN